MKYSDLVVLLRTLENGWRNKTTGTIPSAWIRSAHNVQYFACRKRANDPDLPVVVDVGINYTQGTQTIPDQTALPSALRPAVEDNVPIIAEQTCIRHCNSNRAAWAKSKLVGPKTNLIPLIAPNGIADFHLVMTNLSPWITTHSWESQLCADSSGIGAHLLAHPPHGLSTVGSPFEHLDDLKTHLEEVALWIGHGRATVPSHFRIFVEKHRINNWLLTGNLSAQIKPRVDRSGFVKFH